MTVCRFVPTGMRSAKTNLADATTGMSLRLLFDAGLHVDAAELCLTEREAQIRHMVLWACIVNDR